MDAGLSLLAWRRGRYRLVWALCLIFIMSPWSVGCQTSCRPVIPLPKIEDPPIQTDKYCEPAQGCTFIDTYNDCIKDNETPNCVFFSLEKMECLLCYRAPDSSGAVK